MTYEQIIEKLNEPNVKIDVVLDTDAYNEIDDQYAIAYLLKSNYKCNTAAIYAAPFLCEKSTSPEDGMIKSYHEIIKVIDLMEMSHLKDRVFEGSRDYLPDEETPVISPAAKDLVSRAAKYSSENPLYVVAIGAITNIASALLIDPSIAEKIVVIWLGGHEHHWGTTKEFNMYQDIAAARVVMSSKSPFVQLPAAGVVDHFTVSKSELQDWLLGKNPIADYLARNTINEVENHVTGKAWTRVIWDVTGVAWLMNENYRFMSHEIKPVILPDYNGQYEAEPQDKLMCYIKMIFRDELMTDLFNKLLS